MSVFCIVFSTSDECISISCVIFQGKLSELQTLMMQLLGEKNMLHNYHEEASFKRVESPDIQPHLHGANGQVNGQHTHHNGNELYISGLKTYFFSDSQTFASGFNLNLQICCVLLVISFAVIPEIDSLNYAYLLICCLRIGNDKNA